MDHSKRGMEFIRGGNNKRIKLENIVNKTHSSPAIEDSSSNSNTGTDEYESEDSCFYDCKLPPIIGTGVLRPGHYYRTRSRTNGHKSKEKDEDERTPLIIAKVFTEFPSEILSHIFSFLDRKDLLEASCVCRRWRTTIFTTAELWRKKHITIRCLEKTSALRRKKVARFESYCGLVGNFLRHLKIRCVHRMHPRCRAAANILRSYLTHLQTESLQTFHLSNLLISSGSLMPIKPIGRCVSRILNSQRKMLSFNVTKSHWPGDVGLSILICLQEKFHRTLQTLKIDEFFDHEYSPVSDQRFIEAVSSFEMLQVLSISYTYLNDDLVRAFISPAKKRLNKIDLVATNISPLTPFISTNAWTALMDAYPKLKIEFKVHGYISVPSITIPAILDPALRIQKLDLDIGPYFQQPERGRLHMAHILRYIGTSFRKRLQKFTLNIDNMTESIDKALIKMVKRCRALVHVKIMGHFTNYEFTSGVIKELIRERRDRIEEFKRMKREVDNGTFSSISTLPPITRSRHRAEGASDHFMDIRRDESEAGTVAGTVTGTGSGHRDDVNRGEDITEAAAAGSSGYSTGNGEPDGAITLRMEDVYHMMDSDGRHSESTISDDVIAAIVGDDDGEGETDNSSYITTDADSSSSSSRNGYRADVVQGNDTERREYFYDESSNDADVERDEVRFHQGESSTANNGVWIGIDSDGSHGISLNANNVTEGPSNHNTHYNNAFNNDRVVLNNDSIVSGSNHNGDEST